MGIRRVEAGILDYGTDIDRSMTPFDIGLGKFVDFSKTHFVGRTALTSVSQQERLFGIISQQGVPRVGNVVLAHGKPVGHIRVGDWSPTLQQGVGYVLFDACDHSIAWVGQRLTLRDADGQEHDCKVVTLPFFDAKKRLPKGLALVDE